MAKLITSVDDVNGAIECLELGTTGEYLSFLNPSNMNFDNAGELTGANLLILESPMSETCYTLAYATDMVDEIRMRLERKLERFLVTGLYLELGKGHVDASGISLSLTPDATDKLHFEDQNIVQITDSSGNDVIYINTRGVNSGATLDFSRGNDTIKFNGATPVNTIRGG